MDYDTTREKESYEKILSAFANQEADILIGTQMIVKGHDFPNVTLVGILAADMSLFAPDFRARERTFQLITQAAGRAGRGEKEGLVILQTYHPDDYAVRYAAAQDYEEFYNEEILYRKMLKYPPAFNMLKIHLQSESKADLERVSDELADFLKKAAAGSKGVAVIGPSDETIAKINDIFRKQIYLKSSDIRLLVALKDEAERFGEKNTKNVNLYFRIN